MEAYPLFVMIAQNAATENANEKKEQEDHAANYDFLLLAVWLIRKHPKTEISKSQFVTLQQGESFLTFVGIKRLDG